MGGVRLRVERESLEGSEDFEAQGSEEGGLEEALQQLISCSLPPWPESSAVAGSQEELLLLAKSTSILQLLLGLVISWPAMRLSVHPTISS